MARDPPVMGGWEDSEGGAGGVDEEFADAETEGD